MMILLSLSNCTKKLNTKAVCPTHNQLAIDPQYKDFGAQSDDKGQDGGIASIGSAMLEQGVGAVTELFGKSAPLVGAAFTGVSTLFKMIGDEVQKNKCKLKCCPSNNLAGSWACKYQSYDTCNGSYSDYPGRGDHACWWNSLYQRCETGKICRDKTFNWFSLFGSVCPSCERCPFSSVQWTREALKKATLPEKYYVAPWDEYEWCAPRGSPGDCDTNRNRDLCERSYADHNGDKNCRWNGRKCVPGNKCDNARERVDAARRLGLSYFNAAWRRGSQELSYQAMYVNNKPDCKIAVNQPDRIVEMLQSAGNNQSYTSCVNNCRNNLKIFALCACRCLDSLGL